MTASAEGPVENGLAGLGRRTALSTLGASLGAMLAAGWDAMHAIEGAASASTSPFSAVALVDLGLVAPVALLVGVGVGVATFVLLPRRAIGIPEASAFFERGSEEARARRGAALFLGALSVPAFVIVVAHAAKRGLTGPETPKQAGAVLALSAVVAVMCLYGLVSRLTPVLAPAFRGKGGRSQSPLWPLVLGVVLAAVLLASGIASGTPGGEGGVLGILGVLKREELDLRAPGLLLLVALGAALGPGLLRRLFAPLSAALALLPLVLTVRAGPELDRTPSLTTLLERSAPLGKICLRLVRRLADADHDGFSRTYGGGDCNDADPRVFPAAEDIPGNGIDEDCSGKDSEIVAAAPAGMPKKADAAPAAAVPPGLNVLLITVDTLRADLG
jgi:choline-sulfatase